jgi:hypothetical protein
MMVDDHVRQIRAPYSIRGDEKAWWQVMPPRRQPIAPLRRLHLPRIRLFFPAMENPA